MPEDHDLTRIVAGVFRGRALIAPRGTGTRPTADRVRQALFDTLLHAPWGGRVLFDGAHVLDAFAGTGALGLEALSRGAANVSFIERDRVALSALRANIVACRAEGVTAVFTGDAVAPPPGRPCELVFLDPPYGRSLIGEALTGLGRAGWLAPSGIVVAETGRDEVVPIIGELLSDRTHGAARLTVWRLIPDETGLPAPRG